MKRSTSKNLMLIAFTFIGSYATTYVILPHSYWQKYADLPVSRIVIDCLLNLLFCIAILAISMLIDRRLNKRIPWMTHPFRRLLTQVFYQIIGVLLFMILLSIVYFIIVGVAVDPRLPALGLRDGVYALVSIILWALMVSALTTGDYLLGNWKTATMKAAEFEIKAAQNKQLAAEIELEALKLQLDPHFVFNNLSVLAELILKDQQLGYEYTENFAKVYRYLLTNSKKTLISLREELRFLDAYLFLINNRMGEGSIFRIDIDESKLDMLIPPVTLQLFIENALKYNRTEEDNPLVVNIYSNDEDELVVSNILLPLIKENKSTGIGLKNIIDRYALLGDRKPVIEKDDKNFTIKVPLIK
ncbi:sensor histidine kinase [Pedobacter antarcticus]|uniref:sensor histidine kinase n=1 Tax=Pedobacter antarcticus TaxID=34086 RepID=UPI00292EFC14|nr:sensor histidine kinase [Pedobacter antarcticus]